MKKLVSLLLSLIMFAQLFSCAVFASPGYDYKMIYRFDDLATNYVPTDILTLADGTIAYVAQTESDENKALKIVSKQSSSDVGFKGFVFNDEMIYSYSD